MPLIPPGSDHQAERDKRRIKRLAITGDALIGLLQSHQTPGRLIRMAPGTIPDDARSVGLVQSNEYAGVVLYLHSDSFEECDIATYPRDIHGTYDVFTLPTKDDLLHKAVEIGCNVKGQSFDVTYEPTEEDIAAARKIIGGRLLAQLEEHGWLAE